MLRANGTNFIASTATFADTYAASTLLYANGANTVQGLATANTSALVTSNTGVPAWTSGGTASRLLRTDGTTVSFAQAVLTTDVTGTLPIANGGTNNTAYSTNALLYFDGTSITATSTQPLYVGQLAATTTTATSTFAGGLTIDGTGFVYDFSSNNTTLGGSLGTTGTRVSKGWFTDLETTNAMVGSITGNAATVTTNANLTGHVTSVGNAAVLGSFSSAQLLTALSDDTGTGVAVFGTAPTFTTSLTSPLIIGGTGTTQTLTYKTTTGVGATGADHIFQVGNDGATEAMRILNSGNVGIGTTGPGQKLDILAGDERNGILVTA